MKFKNSGKKLLAGGLLTFMLTGSAMAASSGKTMFEVYEANRASKTANYITEDFVLLGHSLMLSHVTEVMEQQILSQQLELFTDQMLAALQDVKSDSKTAKKVTAANINYFSILKALLAGEDGKKAEAKVVRQELALILDGKGNSTSPLTGLVMDYSRFIPRGHYAGNKAMENWFRAMTWTAGAWFPAVASKATGVDAKKADFLTAQAMEIANIIDASPSLTEEYDGINGLLTAVFGPVEDFTWKEYQSAAKKGETPAELRKRLADSALKQGSLPAIQDGIVNADKLEKGQTPAYVLLGMRLFPGRYTPDAAAMQRLVFPATGSYTGKDKKNLPTTAVAAGNQTVKGFTTSGELMGLLGSTAAKAQAKKNGETLFARYDTAYKSAEKELTNPSSLMVNTSLMRYWLQQGEKGSAERHLTSMLGYWTWGRHTGLLFAKQPNTSISKGLVIPSKDDRPLAFLTPATDLYLRLQNDIVRLRQALSFLDDENDDFAHDLLRQISRYEELMQQVIEISEQETAGHTISKTQSDFLNKYDKKLYALTHKKDSPIVVDVQTDGNSGMALEEAVGYARIEKITVGADKLPAVGALFTHTEFKKPVAERMTDAQWQQEAKKL